MKSLIIVESPAKAKKISQLIDSNSYKIIASFGHIRNLAKKNMGIDIANNFDPIYENLPIRSKQIKEMKDEAKQCSEVILGGDADREGEAICWHIANLLKLPKSAKRIVFHEITKTALQNAIDHPSKINMDLVNAQQARRIIDRLVGFEISPILWKHIQPNLSAGRVQSASLKLICDREKDIEKFNSELYYKTTGKFNKSTILSTLDHKFTKMEDAKCFLENCVTAQFRIENIKKGSKIKKPASPYTTSSLLQDGGSKLGMSSKQIMNYAQKLYESGKITYHRTDSVNLSEQIMKDIKEYIITKFGNKYYKPTKYKTNIKCAQEAHEAIRPVNINERTLGDNFNNFEIKVYELIWKRTVASQMSYAEYNTINVKISISTRDEKFVGFSEKLIFDGFLKVYIFEKNDDDNEEKDDESPYDILCNLKEKELVKYNEICSEEKYSTSNGRFNEAGLIKKMKDTGIGRPSTYSSIIGTLQDRQYVNKETRVGEKKNIQIYTLKSGKLSNKVKEITLNKENNKLFPTEIGKITNSFLEKNFEKVLESEYTSNMENDLDEIANGKNNWTNTIKKFYEEFHPTVEKMKEINNVINEKSQFDRFIGKDPITSKNIFARIAKFGPVVQMGDKGDKNIKYASIENNIPINQITLNEAVELLQYPKNLGDYQAQCIIIKKGKFGPFIQWGNDKTYSLGDTILDNINRQVAIEIISTEAPGIKKQYNKFNKFSTPNNIKMKTKKI